VAICFSFDAYVLMGRVRFGLRGHVGETDVVRFSRIIDAPPDFVYDWCTDYREDDNRITGSKSRRRILEKTRLRVIYTTREKGTKSLGAASIVTLHPSDSWHVDSIGDQRDTFGDYRLTKLGRGRTRLNIVFKIKRKSRAAPNKSKFLRHLDEIWNKYVETLEKDYRRQTRKQR
jgi:hypothetical protein